MSAQLRAGEIAGALGEHTPATLGNPDPVPLPGGGAVTVEPGGQLEISSAPAGSLAELHAAVTADHETLTTLLADAGLVLGDRGLDPYRRPRRILETPRYAAMERSFDEAGRTMMTATAGLQICLDAGEAHRIPARWAALHEMGPALLALFANSPADGWASARMAAWLRIDPLRTAPVPPSADPARAWAEYALRAPLLCVARPGGNWDVPPGVTFADWIRARRIETVDRPPTLADLDYHLNTLFPPVRPRGYLEVRYLDTQPGGEWIVPAALLVTLLDSDALTDRARALAADSAGRWHAAARLGLADEPVRRSAAALADLACRHLDRTGLSPEVQRMVVETVRRRLHRHREGISA